MSEGIASKMCFRKKPFNTLVLANQAIGKIRAYHPECKDMRAYPCPICDRFHITTKPLR